MSFEKSVRCIHFLSIGILFSLAIPLVVSNELTTGVSSFAAEFYEQCAKSKPGNMVISPLSVATSLALLMQAANGSTFEELRNGLHFKVDDKDIIAEQFNDFYGQLQRSVGSSSLSIANQIYIQQGREINRSFDEIAIAKFESGVESLDFANAEQSAEIINRFVDVWTHGKIPNFVKPDSLNENTAMFLVNAIYFRGTWENKFSKQRTREEYFYISQNETARTDFMSINNKLFNYARLKDLNASGLRMKYANSSLSFVIILPNNRFGLPELEAKLRNYDLTAIVNQMRPRRIDLTIPKFKIDYEIELSAALQEMGMTQIFSQNADLSGLLAEGDTGEPLKVTKVIHKAIIEINERGAEASAATGIKVAKKSAVLKPLKFTADHPFFYYIHDISTEMVLFSGRFEKVENK